MTVAELISLARGHFTDFDGDQAQTFLQAVHNDILRRCRVRADISGDISLTSGTARYSIPADTLKIWDVAYYTSATQYTSLVPKSVDELDSEDHGGWRRESSGTPIYYDERAGELWLYPTPDTTTATGYPKVVIQYVKTATLAKTDSLPTAVPDWEAWLYGLCKRYAAMKNPNSVQMFAVLEQQAFSRLQRFSQGKAARGRASVKARIPRIRTV